MKAKKAKRKRRRKRKDRPILRGIGCVILELIDNISPGWIDPDRASDENNKKNNKLLESVRNKGVKMTLSNVEPIYRNYSTLNDPNLYPASDEIQTLRNLEEGVYTIDETIELPWVYGTTIKGVGSARFYGLHGGGIYAGYTTNLLWDGITDRGVNLEPPDETQTGAMFHITGESTLIEKVTIGNAPIGVLINREKEGIGTGKVIMRDCTFNGCKTAVETGPTNANNDEITLDHVTAEGCETLLRVKNAQSMGFRIRSCFVKNGQKNNSGDAKEYYNPHIEDVYVKDIIDVRAGGIIYVEDMTVIHADSILKFNPDLDGTIGGSTGSRIGSSNGYYSLKNIKLDTQAGTPKIVAMSDFYRVRIIVENVQAPSSPWQNAIESGEPATMYDLKGHMAITIRDCNLFKDCISWVSLTSSYIPNIVLDHCSLGNSPTTMLEALSKAKSKGRCYISTRNCYNYDSRAPLPEITAYIDAE